MSKLSIVVITVIVVVLGIWLGLIGVARSGAVNVAATHESVPGVDWFFGTLAANSIDRHAEHALENGEITPPKATSQMVQHGAAEYAEMCVTCHGAPGVKAGPIGQGLFPPPPDLSKSAREMDAPEIYWVLSNGIRHTGMPAFGDTHDAEELWATAYFVDRLASMTPDEYQRIAAAQESAGETHDEHESGVEHATAVPEAH